MQLRKQKMCDITSCLDPPPPAPQHVLTQQGSDRIGSDQIIPQETLWFDAGTMSGMETVT
jgi:hypothetical protein